MEPDERHVAAFESPDPSGRSTAKISGDTAVDLSIDLSSERPHATGDGLRPDRSMRWLGAAMAGGAVLLLTIVGIVRASDDGPAQDGAPDPVASSDVLRLEPQLREPLQTLVVGMETIRLESMTAEFLRNTDRPLARVSRRPSKPTATPAASSGVRRPRSGDAATTEHPPARGGSGNGGDVAPSFRALPAPPPVETPAVEPAAAADAEPAPVEDARPASPPSPS